MSRTPLSYWPQVASHQLGNSWASGEVMRFLRLPAPHPGDHSPPVVAAVFLEGLGSSIPIASWVVC